MRWAALWLDGARHVGRARRELQGMWLARSSRLFLSALRLCERRRHLGSSLMVIRITSMVLSLAGLLALVLGLFFWTGSAMNLLSLHMLLGLLAVCALWIIGVAQALLPSGSWMIAAATIIVGGLMIVLGLIQTSLMVGDFHWLVQIIHLLLGLLTIGMGHMAAARARKTSSPQRQMK
jgi:hypothetical protein